MKGDFTRSTFRPEKHYSSVRMQQGRLQLDADWNEQVDIQNYLHQSQVRDTIGSDGASKLGGGFEIKEIAKTIDFEIAPGHFYVGGILCELEQKEKEKKTTYSNQPDHPNALQADLNGNLKDGETYIAYLDVWQRHISAIEDSHIREVALNGLDTATRTKTVWQVKLIEASKWDDLIKYRKAELTADLKKLDSSVSSQGSYQGSENQLYRVEIHKPGSVKEGTATFKWSRDNGTVVSAIERIEGNTITISNPGRDASQSFAAEQWVEILDEEQELNNQPGTLVRLQKVSGKKLVVAGNSLALKSSPKEQKLKVRRWDNTSTGEIPITLERIPLEQGIEIQFDKDSEYQTGDYWLIPARAVTNDIDWPYDDSNNRKAQPRYGIQHHYSRLALLEFDIERNQFNLTEDCRNTFPPLVRCLDKTGDTMTGPLEIQADLYITGKQVEGKYVAGKVGIGTKQPSAALDIQPSLKATKDEDTLTAVRIQPTFNDADKNNIKHYGLLVEAGNVGIGTPQPGAKLEVKGTTDNATAAAFQVKNSADSSLLYVRNDGNVGIGIDNPQAKLDVAQTLRITQAANFVEMAPQSDKRLHFTTNLEKGYYFDNNISVASGVISSDNNANLLLQTNGTTRLTLLQENGNVGIGIDNPQAKLDVAETFRITQAANFVEMAPQSDNRLQFTTNLEKGYYFDKGITVESGVISSDNNANLLLQTNGTTRLTLLQNNGNVGIGIDNPQAKLDVAETFRITQATNYVEMAPQSDNRLHFTTNLAEGYYFDKGITVASGTISSQNNANLSLQTSQTTQVTVLQANGNVGLGIETPQEKLHLNGAIRGDQSGALRISTGNGFVAVGPQDADWSHFKTDRPGYHFDKGITVKSGLIGSANTNLLLQTAGTTQVTVLQENGNVGIGIDKPQAKLDVAQTLRITQGDNYVKMAPQSDNRLQFTTNLEKGYYFDKGITVTSGTISSDNNTNLSLQTAGTTQVTVLQENGNVGIGVDNPQAKLDVAQTLRITQADNYVQMAPQSDNRLHFTTNLVEGYYFDKGITLASGTISSQNNANLSLQTTGTPRLTLLQENGNVGIGTENPLARLDIQGAKAISGTGRISSDRTTVTGTQTAFQQELHVGDTIVAKGQARTIAAIDTNRSLTINAPFEPDLEDTTFTYQQPIARLADNQGTTQLIVTSQDDNTIIGTTKPNAKLQIEGNVTVNGNLGYQGRFFQSSSRELKENITTLSSQEVNEFLKGLNAVKFSYKADPEKNMQVGFISEEVPDVLVSPDKKAISNLEIVAILTEAVKEHRKTIRLLTKVVKEQEQKIERLTEKINALEQGN